MVLYSYINNHMEDEHSKLMEQDKGISLNRVTYTLVGTIKSYTTLWAEGDVLPDAIITQTDFERLTMPKTEYLFSVIGEEYIEDDIWSFAQELWDSICLKLEADDTTAEEQELVYNSFAYDNPFWSNRTMYRNMTIMLVVLGSCIMAYLMSSYLAKRRQFYYRLREIGASVMQIWKMAAYECIWSTAGVALMSLAVSYLVSVLTVFMVAKGAKITFFYIFSWKTLFIIIGCVCIVLASSMFAALILFKGKKLTSGRTKISKPAQAILRKKSRKPGHRISLNDVMKRERICHPLSAVFSRVVGILTCVTVLTCMMQIYQRVTLYETINTAFSDFEISTDKITVSFDLQSIPCIPYTPSWSDEEVTEEYFGCSYDIMSMETVIPDNFIRTLNDLSGIRHTDYYTVDATHIFSWEGKGESEYYQDNHHSFYQFEGIVDASTEAGQKLLEAADASLYNGYYFQNTKSIWDRLKKSLDKDVADYDEFSMGNQVIILENYSEEYIEDVEGFDSEENIEDDGTLGLGGQIKRDETLEPGDTLTIHTAGEDIEVTVAGILPAEDYLFEYGGSAYNLVGSESLGKMIAYEDGTEYGYNKLNIELNQYASSEATAKIIAKQCVLNGLQYSSYTETIKGAYNNILKSALVYGTLGVIILILYIFVLSCIIQEEQRKRQKQYRSLHQLGVSLKQLSKARFCEGIINSLYMLISIPVFIISG